MDTTEETKDDFESAPGEIIGGPEPEDLKPEDIAPVIDGWPEPTNAAKTEAQPNTGTDTPTGQPPQPSAPIKDAKQRVFNPEIHSSNPDGSPRFNKRGLFIFKGVGKPKGSAAKDEAEDYGADHYDAQAEQLLRLYYGGMATVFDDENWHPKNEAQHEFVKQPTARMLREMEIPQLPAKLEFALAIGSYSLERATTSQKTKEKLIVLWLKVRGWFGKKKAELPPPDEGKKKPDDSTPAP